MKTYNFCSLENADITIITLTYNSSKYIKQCMNSILESCHHIDDFRVAHLVVDGLSSDNTIEIINNISPTSLIVSREPAGIYEAINYAVSLVQSPYLMYVHSDDEIDKLFLLKMSKVIKRIHKNKEYLLYGTVDFIDNNSHILFSRKPPLFISLVQEEVSIVFHPNAIYSTTLEKLHSYNLNLGLIADKEHITQIAATANLIRVKTAKYRFRMSENSSTMNETKSKKKYTLSLARLYILFFETNLIYRLFLKMNGKSYWQNP